MRKTGLEIESYIYDLIAGELSINGSTYRAGTRPFDSVKEDAVVGFLSGRDGWDGFSQVGIVIVNVYVPDIVVKSPHTIRNVGRLTELSRELLEVISAHKTGDYLLETDSTPTIEQDKGCHFISLRIKYRYNHTN